MEVERVQAIASLFLASDTIPADFIRPENEQPAITTFQGPLPEIPTTDLNELPDQEKVVRLISDAGLDWGIFQVVNHGMPSDLVTQKQCVGKEFFELPQEEKELYAKPNDAKDIEGYGAKLQKENSNDGNKSWVDHLFHRIWPPPRINYQFWPQNPPSYRSIFLCSSYYPPCPRPDLALGVVAHADFSSITILVPNQVPGLQVFKDDRWIDAKYIPNALIIHIGDQIEILSNGKYKAVLHRTTVEKDRTRMSWPVFLEPPGDMVVGPLPQVVTQHNPPKYKAKKFKDYAYCKLNKLPQ